MTQPKWKVALFKRRSEIQPKALIQLIWNLPTMDFIEPSAPSAAAAEDNDSSSGQAAPPVPSEERSYLPEGSRMSARLSFQGSGRIDGEFEGQIIATEKVIVGDNAMVSAEIKAASVIVAGRFSGEMTASESIEIRPCAKVSGNLTLCSKRDERG